MTFTKDELDLLEQALQLAVEHGGPMWGRRVEAISTRFRLERLPSHHEMAMAFARQLKEFIKVCPSEEDWQRWLGRK